MFREFGSRLPSGEPYLRRRPQAFHATHLGGDYISAYVRQFVHLTVAGRIGFGEPADAAVVGQSPPGSVQSAGAEADTSVGERLDVLHDGVAMPRSLGEAEQDEEDGFGDRVSIRS